MWSKSAKTDSKAGARRGNSRRQERHVAQSLACQFGDVIDLSSEGMRVACKGKPPVKVGQAIAFKIVFGSQSLAVTGKAVRVRRILLLRYEVGVQFVNVKRSVAAALHSLALFGFVKADAGAPKSSSKNSASGSHSGAPGAGPPPPSPRITALATIPDYYQTLGVAPESSREEIHAAFRRLARLYHPDVSQSEDSEVKFKAAKEAYDILRDPDSRRTYDEHSQRARGAAAAA